MTVKELVTQLQNYNPDLKVVAEDNLANLYEVDHVELEDTGEDEDYIILS